MPREEIPVTPSLITWARARAGYTLEEASEFFGKIEAWEAGEKFPTYAQLEQLADKFKTPIAVFFFPEPPQLPPISETFRTLPETQFNEIPRHVRYLLQKAKALQLNLAELNEGQNPAERLIVRDLSFTPTVSVGRMANSVRDYLRVSLEDQTGWPSSEVALEEWRQVLNDCGIFVFKDAFRTDEYSGFCLYDNMFPIIYVNNSSAKTRQIFTLFHELAHLLFHTSGIDTLGDEFVEYLPEEARRIERICNRFASQFLFPDHAFEAAIAGHEPTEAAAEEIAAAFHVSRELVFRRFLDRGLIEENVYLRAAERWASQRRSGTGGDYYNTQISYLGSTYIGLALSRYYQGKIDEVKASEYLNISPRNFSTFEARFARRRS